MRGKNGYENDNKILSYNKAKYHIKLSMRGVGKTHGRIQRLIDRYLKKKERFMALYRTPNDLKHATGNVETEPLKWLGPVIHPKPTEKRHPIPAEYFKMTGDIGYKHLFYKDDPLPIGYFRVVSDVNAIKQENFPPSLVTIFIDEFLPVAWKKLPGIEDEGKAIDDIITTVDHDSVNPQNRKHLTIIMYGNFLNLSSPLYRYFGIKPFQYGIYRPNKDTVIEACEPFGKAKEGCHNDYRHCELVNNDMAFVRPVPKNAYPIFSVRLDKHYYTFYKLKHGYENYIKETNKHIGNTRYGSLINRQEDEMPLFWLGGDGKKFLITKAIECRDYYDSVFTKQQYLEDLQEGRY